MSGSAFTTIDPLVQQLYELNERIALEIGHFDQEPEQTGSGSDRCIKWQGGWNGRQWTISGRCFTSGRGLNAMTALLPTAAVAPDRWIGSWTHQVPAPRPRPRR